MGVVYKGERLGIGRRVAIKFLHADLAADPGLRQRFEREAKAMSQLHHPHCVPVIDFGLIDDAPYIVLEFVPGESLTHLIARGPIPQKRAIAIMRQILAGLEHAHGLGIVHRDIKPDNVILAEATGTGDQARLFDFGLARIVHDAQQSVARAPSTIAVGTPSYMSPEQALGEDVDARSDVYGCGVVLFQMLTGKKPFVGDKPMDVLKAHVELAPPKLRDMKPDAQFPPALEAAIARALAKRPERRFPSALEFAAALAEIAEAEASPPPPPPRQAAVPVVFESSPPGKDYRWTIFTWLFLLGLAGALAFLIWYLGKE
jgi:serine/threonine-protein kinase